MPASRQGSEYNSWGCRNNKRLRNLIGPSNYSFGKLYAASSNPKPCSQKTLSHNVKLATQDSERGMAIDHEKVFSMDDDDFQDF